MSPHWRQYVRNPQHQPRRQASKACLSPLRWVQINLGGATMIKNCHVCGIWIPQVPEWMEWEEGLCNSCYDTLKKAEEEV